MTLSESIVREMVEVQGLSFSKIAKNFSINILYALGGPQ